MKKNNLILLPALIVGSACLFLLLQCGSPKRQQESPIAGGDGTVGIRNFRQLFATLTAVTGVDPGDAKITNYFNSAKSRLSLDGNVEKVSPSLLLATTSLTSLFCDRMIRNELRLPKEQRQFLGSLDFYKPISEFTVWQRKALIEKYTQIFWRRDPTQSEGEDLLTMMQQMEAEGTSPKRLVFDVVLGLCTAVGSSLDSLRL